VKGGLWLFSPAFFAKGELSSVIISTPNQDLQFSLCRIPVGLAWICIWIFNIGKA